ncbi:membrane protein YdbS with pleckstrin-like domain [Bradyrhizobium sp. USDA 377]
MGKMTVGQEMAPLRLQVGQMGLAAPKSTAWKIVVIIAALPILLLVIGPTLMAWLAGTSPDLHTTAGGLAALVLILLPTWIAVFLNHRHVVLVFLTNFLSVSVAVLCSVDICILSWVGLGGEAWFGLLGWQVALIWSFINSKRPDAAELDHSAPPIPSLTAINT